MYCGSCGFADLVTLEAMGTRRQELAVGLLEQPLHLLEGHPVRVILQIAPPTEQHNSQCKRTSIGLLLVGLK